MKLRYVLFIVVLFLTSACHYSDLSVLNPSVKPVGNVLDAPKETISPEIATGRNDKPIVTARKFMVVTANPLATKAGQKILKNGGSAVDAAIAIQAVLNVVEPQSSGIGGGGFLVHFDKKSNIIIAYDGRETAPAHSKPTLFIDTKTGKPIPFEQAATGGNAVAVPAVLKMLALAHKEQGKLPWKN